MRDEESPAFTLESTGFSDESSIVGFPKLDVLFGAWVDDGVVAGVAADGAGCVGPVVAAEEFVFVGVLAITCLFAVLDDGGWPKEETSGRRRFSGCDS